MSEAQVAYWAHRPNVEGEGFYDALIVMTGKVKNRRDHARRAGGHSTSGLIALGGSSVDAV